MVEGAFDRVVLLVPNTVGNKTSSRVEAAIEHREIKRPNLLAVEVITAYRKGRCRRADRKIAETATNIC
jgi:hypothetical protein